MHRAIVVVMVVVLAGCAGTETSEAPASTMLTAVPLRADAQEVFVPGEECVYGISWGGILPVGRIVYRYDEIETREGRFLVYEGVTQPVLAVEAFLKSSGTIRTLADPRTFLPVTTFWVSANEDPHSRTTVFDQDKGVALAGKWASTFVQAAKVEGSPMFDPIGAIFVGRILDLPEDGSEIRALMVDGAQLHLMTVRHAGREDLVFEGDRVPCTRFSLRTDRFDDEGKLIEEEPWNDVVAWVAENPARTILRISGKVRFGNMVLRLARRTVPERP